MKRTMRCFEFRCPKCHGSHYGISGIEGARTVHCHDERRHGCLWSGPNTWEIWIWVETFAPENQEEYDKLHKAFMADANHGLEVRAAKRFGKLRGLEDFLEGSI